MNFRVVFGAEDEVRLSPFKDDNPKDTENSTFEASSLLVVKAKRTYKTPVIHKYFGCFHI